MTSAEAPLTFAREPASEPGAAASAQEASWKVMVVDDDDDVHRAIRLALAGFRFDQHPIQILEAYSAQEARELLSQHPDTAVIFLDVIMEERDSGLRFVRELRENLGHRLTRVVLLTGQPDEVPEHAVIQPYDINDYKNKTDLTQQRLLTTTTTALRTYRDLYHIEHLRSLLERKVESQMDELREKNRQLEEMLNELQRIDGEKNTLLGIVAHDLKNPLSGMAGHIQLLLDEPDLRRDEREESLRTLQNGVTGMTELVKRLLNANAVERGEIAMNPEPVNVADLCCLVARNYALRLVKKNQQLAVEVYCNRPVAWTDRALTHQVVDNLYSNALKFSPAGKPIRVRVKDDSTSGGLRVEVQDEGPGISAEEMPKLFQKFTRLSAKPTAGENSTGLGLSIVRILVERMNGRIWCESEAGKGATFLVQFPGVRAEGPNVAPMTP